MNEDRSAWVFLLLFVLGVGVGLYFLFSRIINDNGRVKENQRQVSEWVEKLDEMVDENGLYKHYTGELPTDPWGSKLNIHYRKTNHTETLTVRSVGRDGIMFTKDDVVEKRTRFHSLGDHLKDAAQGATQGVRQGLRK